MALRTDLGPKEQKAKAAVGREAEDWLRENLAPIRDIFDKKRYRKIAEGPYTRDTASRLQLAVTNDAAWKAIRKAYPGWRGLVHRGLTRSFRLGATEAQEMIAEDMSEAGVSDIDWKITRSELVEASRQPINGFKTSEHARILWELVLTKMDAALRRAALRGSGMQSVRTSFSRSLDQIIQETRQSLENTVGDAYARGVRWTTNQLANSRFKVR